MGRVVADERTPGSIHSLRHGRAGPRHAGRSAWWSPLAMASGGRGGHPRFSLARKKAWMPGTRPGTTSPWLALRSEILGRENLRLFGLEVFAARRAIAFCHQACKPGSVPRLAARRWPFIWDAACAAPLATNPGDSSGNVTGGFEAAAPPLFGLAPGGVCRAAFVTKDAVRSYRTLSPLPPFARELREAVCFLWHCPWGRPRRTLSGTVSPWSPDFPLRRYAYAGRAAIRPADKGAIRGPRGGVRSSAALG